MADFNAALPSVIKWSVGENKFNEDGKSPKSLSLFIPLESIDALAAHLRNMSKDSSKVRSGKVWDYNANEQKEVQGLYLNSKGKENNGDSFGNINPAALGMAPVTNDDALPF